LNAFYRTWAMLYRMMPPHHADRRGVARIAKRRACRARLERSIP
jgi:hypothetical protein